jgi:hypothetical protein
MYRNTHINAIDINGARSQNHNKKNYTAYVANSWQGSYDKYIRVIGDKGPCNLSQDELDTCNSQNPTDYSQIHHSDFDLISQELCIKTQRDW